MPPGAATATPAPPARTPAGRRPRTCARTRSCRTWALSLSCSPVRSRKSGRGNRSLIQVTGPANTAALIDQLRADGVVLTYDPGDKTLRADDAPSVTIGRAPPTLTHAGTRKGGPPRESEKNSTRCGRRLSAGDVLAYPEIGGYGVLTCPRPTTPKSQCLLMTEFSLAGGGGR
jgi:hypothetical protein